MTIPTQLTQGATTHIKDGLPVTTVSNLGMLTPAAEALIMAIKAGLETVASAVGVTLPTADIATTAAMTATTAEMASAGTTSRSNSGMLDYNNVDIIKEGTAGATSLRYTANSDGKYYFECASNKQIICKVNNTKIFGAVPATTNFYCKHYVVEVLAGYTVEFSGFSDTDVMAVTFIPYKN